MIFGISSLEVVDLGSSMLDLSSNHDVIEFKWRLSILDGSCDEVLEILCCVYSSVKLNGQEILANLYVDKGFRILVLMKYT